METTLLLSCSRPANDRSVWIVPYEEIEDTEKAFRGYYHGRSTQTEYPSSHERDLETKLWKTKRITEVVVRGEFQHSETPAFGHDLGRQNQLILYRVLGAKVESLGRPADNKTVPDTISS
jgi:hypothetical protein